MAEYLASIFGTEKDKVNCSFYFKIGACRHGDRCSRLHNKPTFSQEVFTELQEKYGEIEEMNVCDNLGDHLVGNVYVKFRREEDAERAVAELNNRWFNGQAVHAELSPVTDFRESCCRQYEMGECTRGGFCNFMHLRPISRNLRRQLYGRGPRHRLALSTIQRPAPESQPPNQLEPQSPKPKTSLDLQSRDWSLRTPPDTTQQLWLPAPSQSREAEPGNSASLLPALTLISPLLSPGHPRGPTPATVPEKETDDIPQTTGMAASETLAPLTSTPDRLKCSQPEPLLKAPLTPQLHLPQAPGLHDVSVQYRDLLLTTPPLIKLCIEGLEPISLSLAVGWSFLPPPHLLTKGEAGWSPATTSAEELPTTGGRAVGSGPGL
ncbi:splicing factor U2AF 26 kDa subunit isoform X2 [Mustela lutreola]|uniref:splicing factor U2AF 26 kDa subunit isoform X2 n=1 Tax=Mustela lutreola TaxID=9666 RepID=UPI002797899E|nr:splicing factor U2AF 26 kDa subunit isoform X2 [Mustela lutreola]